MFTKAVYFADGTIVFQFTWLPIILMACGSLLAIVIGGWLLLLRRKNIMMGLGLVAIGGLFLVMAVPQMYLDRVTLTKSSIFDEYGAWWRTRKSRGFEFEGVKRVTIISVREKKGEPAEDHWIVMKGEKRIEIEPGDLWESYTEIILQRLKEQGIEIVDMTSK